ncbi:MAG TPA: discoidin domain-containing protein [Chthoniobacteraceae bacterium]|nr:discoidin domain-containing protein [Chthoniobacteraceae bacterium]
MTIPSIAQTSDEDWNRQTKGTNLASGREAWLFPDPNWGGKKPEYYRHLLTDGKLSDNLTFGNFEAPDAVRWAWSDLDCVVLIDLDAPQPIERVVARLFGGRWSGRHGRMAFPKEFEIFVSNDKKSFHRVSGMTKTLPAERETADWKNTYYLEGNDRGYVHTFSFPAGVTARYVGLLMHRDGEKILIDEVAVMKGTGEIAANPEDFPEITLAIDSALARFRTEKLLITSSVVTPNWINVHDTRKDQSIPVEMTLELPDGLAVSAWMGVMPEGKAVEGKPGRTAYKLPFVKQPLGRFSVQGPLYLEKRESAALPEGSHAILVTQFGEATHEQKIELAELEIPKVPDWSGFEISLGWMYDEWSLGWPDFFNSYRALGFNAIPTFPRYYGGKRADYLGFHSKDEKLAFLDKGRELGFRIVYNESPFHVLFKRHHKNHPEITNQIGGKPGKHLSPVYRGKFYEEEIARVASHFAETKADTVFLDIELWHLALPEARLSVEYQEALRRSGKKESDFLGDLGREMLVDIHKGIAEAAKANTLPMPRIGSYGLGPREVTREIRQIPETDESLSGGVFDWSKVYPEVIDFSMPSLYVAGNVTLVHRYIEANRRYIGASRIIPWLTPATFGKFDPVRLEYMVYETLLNGANGITYFWYPDFDPVHFYHHAKALKTLHPYKELLRDGRPLPLNGSSKALDYTCIDAGNHRLILIGNYNSNQPIDTRISLPGGKVSSVRDIRTGREYPAVEDMKLTVDGNDCVLLYVTSAGEKQ